MAGKEEEADDRADLCQIGLVSWGWADPSRSLLKLCKAFAKPCERRQRGLWGAVHFSSFTLFKQ